MLHPRLAIGCALALGVAAAAEEAAKPGPRAISPYLARVLNEKLAAFELPKPAVAKPVVPSPIFYQEPRDPSVLVMPKVVVRDGRLPAANEVGPTATEIRALERQAMNHYLGSIDGLDRGFLNRFTIAQVWKKIPVVGTYVKTPFWLTNEERAMMWRENDRPLRVREEVRDLERLLRLGEAAKK
jgi:hypothetical protein